MKTTEEQNAIVKTNENLRINARAGTGKTTTLYHYIKARPENSRVLYIAFNKSVREEAEKKFADIDHLFLHIRTTHSMAFEAIVKKNKYIVGFLNPEDVSKILNIRDFVMCTHIVKMIDHWCGCSCVKVEDANYKSIIKNGLALKYVEEHYDKILLNARKILKKMNDAEIPITHDFYLKKWQLGNPVLKYDYILFDECFPYNQHIITSTGKMKIGSIVKKFLNNENIPLIKSYNEKKDIFEYKKVKNVWSRDERELIKLYFPAQRVVKCTPNHKFLTLNGWVEAQNLIHGDAILTSSKKQPYHEILNEDQMCLIKGGQLGDGNTNELSTNIYRTRFIQGNCQKEYLYWKANLLNCNDKIEYVEKNGYAQNPAYRVQTTGFYCKDDILNRKSIIDNIDDKLLSIMIMDDGSLQNGKNGYHIHSCTGHGLEMNKYLSNKLLDKFGIKSRIIQDKRKVNCYFLTIKTEDSKKISEIIGKYVHPSMSYKVHEEYRHLCGTYKWDNENKSYGCIVFLKSELLKEKEEVYDIEVEDNHNFLLTSNNKRKIKNFNLGINGGIIAHNCQDASESMLDVFKKQKGIKVAVGDSHQQIYSWRNAVNSLDKLEDFKELELTKSFRFDQDIANMAIRSIKWKKDLLNDNTLNGFMIVGAGKNKEKNTKAIIGRTNVKLLSDAINQVVIDQTCKKPYFEGGFSNYSIGNIASVTKDILEICSGKSYKVKSPKLKNIVDKNTLKTFIQEIEDANLAQALLMVEAYGSNLIPYINKLKEMIVEDKEDADLIFTTVHKSKGMEYDEVILLDDFSDKMKLFNTLKSADAKFLDNTLKGINEEINLVYVGITRTKGTVHIPINIFTDVTDYIAKVPNKFAKKKK